MLMRVLWALYHTIMMVFLCYWFIKKETCGVCFIGFLLLYTQQWWIAERREEGGKQ